MPEFSHLAGDPALDLLNTVEWRLRAARRIEDLSTFERVLAWAVESDLLSSDERERLAGQAHAHPRVATSEHRRVIALRERVYDALVHANPEATAALAADYAEAVAAATLVREGGGFHWQDRELTLASPRHRIARVIAALLSRDDLDRLHQCEDDDCGWVYLDMSPRRNRRWCASNDCGDRNRARAYYARKRAAGTA